LGAARTAGHLVQQLHGSFRRSQIAAREAEIGIDHSNQGEKRKMPPLCDNLRADDEVDFPPLDRFRRRPGRGRPRQGIAGHDDSPSFGPKRTRLFCHSLNTWADGDQSLRRATFGTGFGWSFGVTAMMALQAAVGAVFDQPGGDPVFEHFQASRGEFKIRNAVRKTLQRAGWAVGVLLLALITWRLLRGA
jgi:hypothetical protein